MNTILAIITGALTDDAQQGDDDGNIPLPR